VSGGLLERGRQKREERCVCTKSRVCYYCSSSDKKQEVPPRVYALWCGVHVTHDTLSTVVHNVILELQFSLYLYLYAL